MRPQHQGQVTLSCRSTAHRPVKAAVLLLKAASARSFTGPGQGVGPRLRRS